MRARVTPSRPAIALFTSAAVMAAAALIAGAAIEGVAWLAALFAGIMLLALIVDYAISARAWRASAPTLQRALPAAFAIGVKQPVTVSITLAGAGAFEAVLHDHAPSTFVTDGLPGAVTLQRGKTTDFTYQATPTARGDVSFAAADVRLRSRLGLCQLFVRAGDADTRRVFPDFAQVAKYAWLAGDRRLQEIGVKTFHRRGEGTDFKQLAEYRTGDPIRHIDWRATLRQAKPIVREFQDERDQCVMLLVDCGRRMRAHDTDGIGTTHFDQVMNAMMLMSYVALQRGDAVGAMTFGTAAEEERSVPPKKGKHALNGLMAEFFGVQPTLHHSDYVLAAQQVLRRMRRRALVIVITNFRDEDASELGHALRLLRSRHLVLVASMRERIVGDLMMQPLVSSHAAVDVASAQLYEQARRDAFNRLADRDSLMVDAEPNRLGIALVNRYHAVKRAGRI